MGRILVGKCLPWEEKEDRVELGGWPAEGLVDRLTIGRPSEVGRSAGSDRMGGAVNWLGDPKD